MFKKKIGTNLIQFHSQFEKQYKVFPHPIPASTGIPSWYKEQERYWGNPGRTKEIMPHNGLINTSIKGCMPVFDAMTAGYYIPLYTDIVVKPVENDYSKVIWGTQTLDAVTTHSAEQYDKYHVDTRIYSPYALKFENPWIVKTPPGYSCLFITPMHYDHLPFKVLGGVVDTDKYPLPVNLPFFIEKDFEGIIETGTPMIQVIPFKRDRWRSESGFDEESYLEWEKARSYFSNKYKRFFRQEKSWK
jgi:hypothetical protein